jgi:hypothetical protein
MTTHIVSRPAPHPKWKWPTGSVVLGDTKAGSKVWISREARTVHCFTCGQSGQGKSMLLAGLIRQDVLCLDGEARSVIVFDPHGTLIANTLRWVATHRLHELRTIRVLDPSDPEHIFGLNPVRPRENVDPAVIASAVLNAILQVWGGEDATALPQLRETGKAILYVLCSLYLTFLEIDDLVDLEDRLGLRQYVIDTIRHPSIRRYWATIAALPRQRADEKLSSFVRRMNEFLLPTAMRRIFAARDRVVDFRACMDAGEVVLVDLSYGNGRISEDESTLLGCLMLADIFLSCLGRPEGSPPVYLYIDECHRFLTEDVANILDQARKFGLHIILATQHLGHLRDRGEHIYRSVMTNTRTKIIFGGLDDDDATLMARNLYRGSFQLERAKHAYDKPTVSGQDYDWLRSESMSRGTAHAVGTSETYSEGESVQHSTTESRGTTFSETDTVSTSETLSKSSGFTEGHTEQRSGSESQSDSWSQATGRSGSSAQAYNLAGLPVGGPIVTDGWSASGSVGSTSGTTEEWGSADSSNSSYSSGSAISTGEAHSTSSAVSESSAMTEGTTRSTERSRGTSVTDTTSEQRTQGRAQTLRSVFQTMPTTPYSLDELVHMASVSLANLNVGEAIVKIGKRRPVRISTLRIKDGWATPEHVERVKRRLAEQAPFVTSLAEARAAYIAWRRDLIARVLQQQLAPPAEQVIDLAEEEEPAVAAPVPALKDPGWG